jgi:hypothetical protein
MAAKPTEEVALDLSGANLNKVRLNNGWTPEIEALIADWSDRAQCYSWMHDKTSRAYAMYNQYLMIPVIVLSTLTGTANFGLGSIFNNDQNGKTLASLGIGGVSIITGIISTLANFLRYGQGSEAHSLSSLMWAKFSRLISIEMALHPDERMEAFAFLKMFRIELDRLVESSPSIPENVIVAFKREFRANNEVKKPDITGLLEHTKVYDNKGELLKKVATDASMMLLHKKRFFKDMVLEEIDAKVKKLMAESKAKGSPILEKNKDSKNVIVVNTPLPGEIDEIIIDVDNGNVKV